MATIIDSYSETNQDNYFSYYGDSNSTHLIGQSFTGTGRTLNSVKLYMLKGNTPAGTMAVRIYAHTGTYGSTGTPTGSPLATSDSLNVADLGTSYGLVTFTFSGANKITLENGTRYFLNFVDSGITGTNADYIRIGEDNSTSSHGGNIANYWDSDTSWHVLFAASDDLCFYVYGDELPSDSPSLSQSASGSASKSTSSSASVSPSASKSPSQSQSPSASGSSSGSLSPSPSGSVSPSGSLSPSGSVSPSPAQPFFGLRVAKSGKNAITSDDPRNLIFSSEYGTLKYYTKQALTVTVEMVAGTATYTHNLGYYPYVEVYCQLTGGNWEYCPFYGSGATVLYSSYFKVTTTTVQVYADVNGIISDPWVFNFIIFIFKNDLELS